MAPLALPLRDVLTMVLAGGKGQRLYPLTEDRAKPAVPFGGTYRIIDFTLSNCLNSGLRRIVVLVQYKSLSLNRHIDKAWGFLPRGLDEFVEAVPPQQRVSDKWYEGTADAIFQNLYIVDQVGPRYLLVLSGDHIYKMNYAPMLEYHIERRAELTIATIEVAKEEAERFGVLETDADFHVTGFAEKPKTGARTVPGDPSKVYASMGIYLFDTAALHSVLGVDAKHEGSAHDFGKNVIPDMLRDGRRLFAYNFRDENKKTAKYWRDVGTIESYYDASMDLVSVSPLLNLYDEAWPIRTHAPQAPPPKFVFAQEYDGGRLGVALDSMVSPGSIISGGRVKNSILSPWVRVNSFSSVESSILFTGVEIGRHARVRRAIVEKGVKIVEGTEVGYDPDADRAKGYTVSEGGVVVVARGP